MFAVCFDVMDVIKAINTAGGKAECKEKHDSRQQIIQLEYFLVDVHRLFLDRPEPRNSLMAAVARMERAMRLADIKAALGVLGRVVRLYGKRSLIEVFVAWICKRFDAMHVPGDWKQELNTFEEVGDMMNLGEMWKQEWRAEGLAEGLAEGREKGLAEGREKGLAEGREKGLAEGREKGLAEGKEEGKAEGRDETIRMNLQKLMSTMNLSLSQAMDALGIAAEDREKYAAKL